MRRGLAIVLRTPTTIAPFGDPARMSFFSGETLEAAQARALERAGLEVVVAESADDVEPLRRTALSNRCVIVLLDRVFLTERAMAAFVRATRNAGRVASFALLPSAAVDYTLPLQSVRRLGDRVVHDVVRIDHHPIPPPATSDAIAWMRTLVDGAEPCVVPQREIVFDVVLPTIRSGEPNRLRYPVTSTVVVSVEHWVHILWLNQIAFGIRWLELLRSRPLWAAFRALSSFSLSMERVLGRMNRIPRGTRVHRSASLSGSILGKNVVIGPNVTVRNSIVADGAMLLEHSVLINSVVGQNTLVTENTFLVSTVAYPDATVGNHKMQVSLVGRGAYVHAWASFIDAKFVGDVLVEKDGALVSTERAFLGSVVGHRAKVAAKVLIQPGREIPNDAVIVMRPDEVISVIPKDLPAGRPLVRDRGTLVPLGEEHA